MRQLGERAARHHRRRRERGAGDEHRVVAGEQGVVSGAPEPGPGEDDLDRERAGDPRPALLERYRDFDDFQTKYMAAAEMLFKERYLLAEDLPRLKALTEKQRELFE